MGALVSKASCQAEKIYAAEGEVMNELFLMEVACEEQREKIQCFFREV